MLNFRLYAALGALIALACLVGWGRHGYALADRWRAQSAIEAANHRQTKANYRAAQIVATARATAARVAAERRSAQIAEEIDHANEEAALWRVRARRFADLGGLRSETGPGADGAPGRTGAAAKADLAARGDGPGAVTVSRADFDTLTGNTERLLRVHAWGEKLVAEGMAVPAGP
ncbi:hypothetical protein [Novosphingobium colocasiae]|uniref:hypothetical protein n=1 Tax=Novosphingobium colocasiae TaxID=1256513 RepID=UPI0035B1DCF8